VQLKRELFSFFLFFHLLLAENVPFYKELQAAFGFSKETEEVIAGNVTLQEGRKVRNLIVELWFFFFFF